jgi:DNA polymerase-3 subunit chi
MTEVLFYHLERRSLEDVLPVLLMKTLERGWRAVVQVGSPERLEALNRHLWSFDEDSFLPHGSREDGYAELQPIWLTEGEDNPNGSQIRFLVDGAVMGDVSAYLRAVHIFDGRDEIALARARDDWKRARSAGHDVTYWQQNNAGRWERKA